MKLSPNFTLEEMTFSAVAARKGLSNIPDATALANLKRTCEGLEQVRNLLGGLPLHISSGYRSLEVNAAVGGRSTSQHLRGQAADFTCPTFGTPRDIVKTIQKSGIEFDQLICEFGRWVHISFSDLNRKQVLEITKDGTRSFL